MGKTDELIIIGALLGGLAIVGWTMQNSIQKGFQGLGKGLFEGLHDNADKDLQTAKDTIINVYTTAATEADKVKDAAGASANVALNEAYKASPFDDLQNLIDLLFGKQPPGKTAVTPTSPENSMLSSTDKYDGKTFILNAENLPATQAAKAAASPSLNTVVFNASIGKRLTLDQVMPEDRQTLIKSDEQQMRDYGALEYKKPQATSQAPQATDSDIWLWRDTNTGAIGTEARTGWEKMTLGQAKERHYL